MKRTLSIFKNIALVVTVLSMIGMVAAAVSQYIDPFEHWLFAIAGLGFLPMLLLNFFFLTFWVIVRLRYAWIPLIGLLTAVPGIMHVVAFDVFNARSHAQAHDLKVMSYNVRNFDLYSWSKEEETRRKMMALIGDEQPDIACFQEFYTQDKGSFNNIATLTKKVGFKYNHILITNTVEEVQHWGIATFTNHRIVGRGRLEFPMKTNNACIYTDIDVDGTVIRVFNMHLQSIYLNRKDYAYIEDFNADKLNRQSNQRIFTKLKNAYQRRAQQVNLIREAIRTSPYPVVLCGDLNDTPVSYTYRTFTSLLNDAFLERGWGIAPTYAGLIPLLRIDYVLHDDRFETEAYKTIRQAYSDHYPIVTELSFKQDSVGANPL